MPGLGALVALLTSRRGLIVLAVLAALAAGAWLYFAGGASQRQADRLERAEEALDHVETRHDVEEDIRNRSPADRRDELFDDWSSD